MDLKITVKDVPVKEKYDLGRITMEEDGTINVYLPHYVPNESLTHVFEGQDFVKVWLDAAAYVAEHGHEIQAKYMYSNRLNKGSQDDKISEGSSNDKDGSIEQVN